jgi:hypothetical protein
MCASRCLLHEFRYNASKEEFEFNFLVKSGRQWGAVGFNPSAAKMAGTEIMWLGGDGSGAPALEYKKAVAQARPPCELINVKVYMLTPTHGTHELVRRDSIFPLR